MKKIFLLCLSLILCLQIVLAGLGNHYDIVYNNGKVGINTTRISGTGISCNDILDASFDTCLGSGAVGGGSGDKWVDGGNYIFPNSTFASNIKVFGYIQSNDWSNITLLSTQILGIENYALNNNILTNITHHQNTYKHGNDTTEIRSVFTSSDNISYDESTGSFSINISVGGSGLSPTSLTNVAFTNESNTFTLAQYFNSIFSNDWTNLTNTFSNSSYDTNGIINGADYYNGIMVNKSINELDTNTEYTNQSWNTNQIPNGADYYSGTQVNDTFKTNYFNVTNITMIRGTAEGGLADINAYNGNSFNITEQVVANALEVEFNWTGITDFNQIIFRYKTDIGETHSTKLQVYNYEDGAWESYGTESEVTDFTVFVFTVFDSEAHIQNGVVSARVIMESNGNTGHTHYFDWVTISKGISTPSSTESDPFALHKSGDTPLEGNWTTGDFTIFGYDYIGDWSGNTSSNINDLFSNNDLTTPITNSTIFIPESQITDLQAYTLNNSDVSYTKVCLDTACTVYSYWNGSCKFEITPTTEERQGSAC